MDRIQIRERVLAWTWTMDCRPETGRPWLLLRATIEEFEVGRNGRNVKGGEHAVQEDKKKGSSN